MTPATPPMAVAGEVPMPRVWTEAPRAAAETLAIPAELLAVEWPS